MRLSGTLGRRPPTCSSQYYTKKEVGVPQIFVPLLHKTESIRWKPTSVNVYKPGLSGTHCFEIVWVWLWLPGRFENFSVTVLQMGHLALISIYMNHEWQNNIENHTDSFVVIWPVHVWSPKYSETCHVYNIDFVLMSPSSKWDGTPHDHELWPSTSKTVFIILLIWLMCLIAWTNVMLKMVKWRSTRTAEQIYRRSKSEFPFLSAIFGAFLGFFCKYTFS